jgi:seryl-tRNA synthetase
VRPGIARKGGGEAFDELLEATSAGASSCPQVDELRRPPEAEGQADPEQVEELKDGQGGAPAHRGGARDGGVERDELLQKVPNPAHESVPTRRAGDSEGEIVREVGERRSSRRPKEHLELGRFEMERGARLSARASATWSATPARLGSRSTAGRSTASLPRASPAVIPPVLVREEAMYGTGFFPAERFEIYEVADEGLYLTGTSEVALAGLHMGEILDRDELPLRYTAFSANFRREAGAAGRDTRGMFRVHQFNKVEMFAYVLPEESWDEHERLLAIEESLASELGPPLPRREHRGLGAERSGREALRHRGLVPVAGALPRAHRRHRTRPTTSRAGSASATARTAHRVRAHAERHRGHRPLGARVLENFQGEVPEVLQEFGAPARIED